MLVIKKSFNRCLGLAMMLLFTAALTLGFATTEANAATTDISVVVDGKNVQFSQQPVIKDGRTLVPLRAIFEAMNMKVDWEQTTKSIQASKDNVIIKLQVGNKNASVGNIELSYIETVLDVEPQIINGSTLVPVRFIGEVSGSDVTWDQTTKTVVVNSKTDRSFGKKNLDANTVYLGYMSNTSKKADGFGKDSTSDGTYVGNHVSGMLSGQGTFTDDHGDKYMGEFKGDMLNGKGTYTYVDGDKYVGEFLDDLYNGKGTYTYADGEKYDGEFKAGMFTGQGTYTFPNGDKYVGQFADDMYNGQGTFTYVDGDKYVGEFKDDMYNGQGTYTYANGDKYVGQFADDMSNGQGTHTFANGDKYVGQFADDMFNGQGTYTFPYGDKYVGQFADNMRNGQGTYTYADGTTKKGTWVNDELK